MKSRSIAFGQTKISSSDPPSTAVCTAYATEPLLPFFHPPIELPSSGPGGCLYLDRRINCTAISVAVLAWIEIHTCLWKAYAVHETREPRDQHSQGLVPRPYSSRTRPVPETASFAPKRQARYRLFDVSWGDGCEKGAGRVASVRLGEQREKPAVSDGQAFIVASE